MATMIHSLTKNTKDTYIYRLYLSPDTLDYSHMSIISNRGNGQFEVQGLISVKGMPFSKLVDIPLFLISELKIMEPRFKMLIATIPIYLLKAYKRVLFSRFTLVPLRDTMLQYNNIEEPGVVVEFKEI